MKTTCHICLLFLLCSVITRAQHSSDYFIQTRHFTYEDGLRGNRVNCTVQDNKGFIWCATQYGLCRFDGKKFLTFVHKIHKHRNDAIKQIWFDGFSAIIISYQNSPGSFAAAIDSLEVMDVNTFQMFPVQDYYANFPATKHKITGFVKNYVTGEINFFLSPYNYEDMKSRATSASWVVNGYRQVEKRARTIKKVIRFVYENNREKPVIEDYTPNTNLEKANVLTNFNELLLSSVNKQRNLYWDSLGYIFLRADSLNQNYIYRIDLSGRITLLGNNIGQYKNYFFDANNDYITSGNNFITNKDQTRSIYYEDHGFMPIEDHSENGISGKTVWMDSKRDNLGNYWISTSKGLFKVKIRKKIFSNYQSTTQDNTPGSHGLRGLFASAQLSVACLASYVEIKTRNENIKFRHDYNHSVLWHHKRLWLSSFFIKEYDINSKKIKRELHSISDEIWSMFPLNENKILLGCTKNLDIYDIEKNEIKHVDHGNYSTPQLVYRVFASGGRIVCVADNGIFILNSAYAIVDYLGKNATAKAKQLPFENINDLHIDKDGIYWFATANKGLYKWDKVKNTVEQFSVEDGFLSSKLCRIEEDAFGNLWISTDFGLALFNKTTRKAKVYTVQDGLPNNEFNRSSSYKDADGNLYFGTIDGYTVFDPKNVAAENREVNYKLIIDALEVYDPTNNQLTSILEEYSKKGKLELSENRKNLQIQVLLMDLEPQEHLYAYQLMGYDKNKNYSNDGKINLNNLPYGTYTLSIAAQQVNGTWNKQSLEIPITILMPFYKTWWFMVLTILCLLGIVLLYSRYRRLKLELENRKLETIVTKRTSELKTSLAEQEVLVQEVHHRVKNNFQVIAAMLDMQKSATANEEKQEVLQDISRRINSMMLVHEMLYNREGFESISVKYYLTEMTGKLSSLISDDPNSITFDLNVEDVGMDVNQCLAIGMITSEAISNSIKHAFHEVKQPKVTIDLKLNKTANKITYSISDNGSGLSKTAHKNGLGMRLIDIFSRQLGAVYTIDNAGGLTYTFHIPFDKHGK